MNLKKHRESVFKSFRGNKKEINRAEQSRAIREWWDSPEQVEGRRQLKKHMDWAAICRLGGLGDYCAKYDKPEMLEAHRQLHSLQWEQENPRQRNIMKKTKKQRRVKVPARPQVTPRKWSKKTARIFDKQFDRFLYDELYVPTKKAWGETDIVKYERNMYGDSK